MTIGNAAGLKSITGMSIEQYLSDPQALNSYAYTRNNPLTYIGDEKGGGNEKGVRYNY